MNARDELTSIVYKAIQDTEGDTTVGAVVDAVLDAGFRKMVPRTPENDALTPTQLPAATAQTVAATDRNIGETFEDQDKRSKNRRIKITGSRLVDDGLIYDYEVKTNDGNPDTIGRTDSISPETLARGYTQVSH